MLELDEEVVQVARKHYDVAREALSDPRVDVRPGDAFESIAELAGELDVIMVDLTDPIGPAARLFEDEFYALCERALRPDGFVVAQTESIHFHPDVVRDCFTALSGRFARTDLLWGAIATYPGAFWTFGIATKGPDPRVVRRRPEIATRLYDVDAHDWFFVPGARPPQARRRVMRGAVPSRDSSCSLAATLLRGRMFERRRRTSAPLPTVATPSTVSSSVSSKLSLEFRPVKAVVSTRRLRSRSSGARANARTCASLITPASARKPYERVRDALRPAARVLLSPRPHARERIERRLGDRGLRHPDRVVGVSTSTSTNDAFLTKIAQPLVNQRIAVVLAGFVQSVATINPGMPGQTFVIIGCFTQSGAADVAAAILGVAPSSVHVTGGS